MSLHRRVKLCLYRKQWPAVGCRDQCYPHTGVAGPQLLPTRDSEAGRCPGWEFELLLTAGDDRDSKESQVRWTYNRWWSVGANLGPTFFRLGGDHSEGSLFTGRHTGDGRARTDSDLVLRSERLTLFRLPAQTTAMDRQTNSVQDKDFRLGDTSHFNTKARGARMNDLLLHVRWILASPDPTVSLMGSSKNKLRFPPSQLRTTLAREQRLLLHQGLARSRWRHKLENTRIYGLSSREVIT
jgi:hypothetical protein